MGLPVLLPGRFQGQHPINMVGSESPNSAAKDYEVDAKSTQHSRVTHLITTAYPQVIHRWGKLVGFTTQIRAMTDRRGLPEW
ncbi:hypothetical protein StoSoilB20_00160 [Arthrobacter sp. StoSoilB20]|nr:hypothetical protein StoSoilB20_00160 [Arthrobacter sp. StoSoilB20]